MWYIRSMMKYVLIFLVSLSSHAKEIKVMTFNTMCDFCKGSDFFNYNERVQFFNKLIKKHSPDLISLQEVRSASQIRDILKDLDEYSYFTNEGFFLSYADPTLIYKVEKFAVEEKGQIWLGPKEGHFTLGWKWALPRQLIWLQLKLDNFNFIFSGSHFDNRVENLTGSASMVNQFLKSKNKIPLLFAADTNITEDMPEYKTLKGSLLENSFDLKESFTVLGEYKNDRELCYTRKGKVFPYCRVDHIFKSKDLKWKVKDFKIITEKLPNGNFPSDHRPVLVTFETN